MNTDIYTDTEELLVPCSYTRLMARELKLQERDLHKLLAGTGVPASALLSAEDSHLTATQCIQALDNARTLGKAPDFGLRLGRQLQPSSHGPMGYLVLSSADVLTALESFTAFLPVRLPFSGLDISHDEQWLNCTLNLKIQVSPVVKCMLQECFALMIQSIVESVSGRKMHNAEIYLAHDKPDYHRLYADYLHSPVHFSQPTSFVRIPIELARATNASGNTEAYTAALQLCRGLLENLPQTGLPTADRVKRQLLSAPIGSVTATDIARTMFVTKRTMQRRLEREGTSYREITERLHAELADRYLGEAKQTIESIAVLLGYYDTAAFRKAFRRWYGQSPGQYRRNLARQGP